MRELFVWIVYAVVIFRLLGRGRRPASAWLLPAVYGLAADAATSTGLSGFLFVRFGTQERERRYRVALSDEWRGPPT